MDTENLSEMVKSLYENFNHLEETMDNSGNEVKKKLEDLIVQAEKRKAKKEELKLKTEHMIESSKKSQYETNEKILTSFDRLEKTKNEAAITKNNISELHKGFQNLKKNIDKEISSQKKLFDFASTNFFEIENLFKNTGKKLDKIYKDQESIDKHLDGYIEKMQNVEKIDKDS